MRWFAGLIVAVLALAWSGPAMAEDDWASATDGLTRSEGFLPFYADAKTARILAAFPKPDEDGLSLRAIAAAGLTAGLGSNPIGLDRGLFDGGSIIAFRRIGGKLIAEQENWTYRASADNPLERKAVRESFARSFLWAGDVIAENAEGNLLVDLSGFLTRDALDVRAALRGNPQGGNFSLADDRTMPDASAALAFPDNVEFDAFLTLTSDEPKREVRMTAAEGRAFTLVQHISLVRLPDDGYTPRAFDPRSGTIDVPFYDFSAPLGGQVQQAVARRFRLEKQDPSAAFSPAKKPLVFYVDSGAPPEIRDALIEGASWWADAFAAAGFPDSYRVEVLPEGAHPLDVRYNVIQWTHRQTRGWSYGGGVFDPRTGEMLKANVILGSQRVRQDRMIFEGLAGTSKTGTGAADDPVEVSLARIRQLAAHEVGHTLGFAHNFAASTNDRASVMDYPAPYIHVADDGTLDFSDAYGVGIGAWDKVAATWLYAQYPDGVDESASGDAVLRKAYASGLRFVDDAEARGVSTGHPYGAVWDNGADPIAALREAMNVRKVALERFGMDAIRPGDNTSRLRSVIVPVYLFHRYQVDAAAKSIGGYEFYYSRSGDGGDVARAVPSARQREAFRALQETLDPAALDLSNETLSLLNPPLASFFGSGGGEYLDGDTGAMFDLLSAADTAASITFAALFDPDRAARLIETRRRDENAMEFDELMWGTEGKLSERPPTQRQQAIQRRLKGRFVSALIALAENPDASPDVRGRVDYYLEGLPERLKPRGRELNELSLWSDLKRRIEAHLARPAPAAAPQHEEMETPPGSPIGAGAGEDCWFCDVAFDR
ncbi:MAG: zinc-dependent metalloprotease [Hyphomonas sp.]|uniref:zinc-dependent metalloprotease n=1 Tax=Hyphomonas sp. TaxID=87 RepID=UPI0035275319